MDYFHADRRPVWRRSPGPDAFLRRAIPVHGLRPADLPGKPARHRDLPLGPRIETLSHGLPPAGPALDAGRCQRKARLAYPCGVGPAAHHPGEDAVRRRRTGVGPDQYRLRPGLDDHRSVPVGLSVGALPHHQGGGEDAHAARPAGQHSEFYPRSRMASCTTFMPSICSCRKPEPSTSWIVATSTLPAFMCCTKPGPSSSRVPSRTSMLIASIRRRRASLDGHHLRPDHLPGRLLHPSGLPRTSAAHPLQGRPSPARRWSSSPTTSGFRPPPSARSTKAAGRWNSSSSGSSSIFGSSSSTARRRTLVKTQIWIAVSALRPRRHRQEAPRPGRLALHFVTDPLGDPLRENAHTSSACCQRTTDAFANDQPFEFIRLLSGMR